MRRSIVGIAALALVLSGCAEQQAAAPPPPSPAGEAQSVPTSMPTAQSGSTPSATAGAVQLTVHHGAPPAGVRPGPAWELQSVPTPASTTVAIGWSDSPSAGCGAAQDVWVRETTKAIVIDLQRSPRQQGITCPAVLVPRRATVPIPLPLGTRTLQQDASSAGVPAPSASAG